MTKDELLNNFEKVYSKKDTSPFIFKGAYPVILMGEHNPEDSQTVLGIGVKPDTYIGVRLCDDNFYISDIKERVVYQCKREELPYYKENKWAGELFLIISKMIKDTEIEGAEILFCAEGRNEEIESYKSVLCYAFSKITGKYFYDKELLNFILPNDCNFVENSRMLFSLNSEKDKVMFADDASFGYIAPIPSEYKILLILTDEKPFKGIDLARKKEKEEDFVIDEYTIYKDLEDYSAFEFSKREKTRTEWGIKALKKGDLREFGNMLKASAEEYLAELNKKNSKVGTLFFTVSLLTEICGIYKNKGVFAFVQEERVDTFVENIGNIYEKKVGKKPNFYICETSDTKEETI